MVARKIGLGALLVSGASLTTVAHAEVTLYGLIDSSIRYSTNEDARGHSKVAQQDGFFSGNRWGLNGKEDLGQGYQSIFVLESGYSIDNGMSAQGGRLFGRQAFVGLQGDFGTVTLGRQFTVMHQLIASYEIFALPNLAQYAFQSSQYTGLRQDNMLKYSAIFGDFGITAQHAFGETAGSFSRNSSTGGTLTYTLGSFKVGGGYQIMRDMTSYYGNPTPTSNQKVWSVGGTYDWGPTTLYLGYTNARLDNANYKNDAIYGGVKYAFAPSWYLAIGGTYDWLKHNNDSGKRFTGAVVLDYAFSKRTEVYLETDYTHLDGAWQTVAAPTTFATPMYGYKTRLGVMAGIRHKF